MVNLKRESITSFALRFCLAIVAIFALSLQLAQAKNGSASAPVEAQHATKTLKKPNKTKLNELEKRILNLHREAQDLSPRSAKYAQNYKEIFFLLKDAFTVEPSDSYDHSFKELVRAGILNITKSSDNKLKIYSWDDRTGGTWRSYDGVYQMKVNGRVTARVLSKRDRSQLIKEIHTIKSGKSTYYVTVGQAVYSSSEMGSIARSFYIKKRRLTPVSLFKTSKKSFKKIEVKYDFFKAQKKFGKSSYKMIRVSSKAAKFRLINADQTISSKYLNYTWRGSYFKYSGVTK